MAIEISARKREMQGTGPARRMRRMGKVPAVLYGGDKNPVNLELDHKDLYLNLRNEKFHASILTLDVGGAKEQVLLRSVSMHPFRPQVQHIDFQRVSKDKKIHMKVPLHFVNADKSPGVKEQGGVVNHVMNELHVACFPDDLPEFVEVNLEGLAVGKSLHARELVLPKGVELSMHRGEDPVVATVVVPQLITEEEETAAVVSAADVPTTEQAAPKEGEAPAEGDKAAAAKGGEKAGAAAKGGDKAAPKAGEKPAADKGEKKEKK
ncbi:MAG: large subunit ribosomal protein [Betaproteobacteria bacterium]|jgi:large subunit ribosomal protein L25|nr:large subunit ribosomal protein [Betaproteobacteria bacterium]